MKKDREPTDVWYPGWSNLDRRAWLQGWLKKQKFYAIKRWALNPEDADNDDREEIPSDAAHFAAEVISSEIAGTDYHNLLIDIDYKVMVIESTTPGHYHLYAELPEPLTTEQYSDLLEMLGEFGIIQRGYARASRKRGGSFLRLPWIKKVEGEPSSE